MESIRYRMVLTPVVAGWNQLLVFGFLATGGCDTEFVNTIAAGHELPQKLGMYLEFAAVTGSVPDFNLYAGISWRF